MKYCKDCKHYWYYAGYMREALCSNPESARIDLVYGPQSVYASDNRKSDGACGFSAKLFEPKTEKISFWKKICS